MSENGVLFDKTKTTIVQYPIGKSVVTYTIPESVSSIGYGAFRRCSSLTSIIIPNSVALIDKYAFAYCSGLTSAVIPNGVTVINDYAFYDCSSLASVIIPKSVTSIRGLAFYGCSRLTSITSLANTPPSVVPLQPFYNVNASITVYVPCGSRVAYQSAGQWNNFTNYNEIFTFTIEVQSNNNTMGMATVTQQPTTCINNQATIEATANSGYRFAQWNDGNTDNPRTITVTSDIVLTAGFEMNTGITDIQTSSFSIYPNPAKNNVTIELSEYTVGTLAVFDLNGKIVVCQSINGTYATINTSSFANGNYIVRLVNDGKPSEGVRFVKQ
jgi:hypothetical protein